MLACGVRPEVMESFLLAFTKHPPSQVAPSLPLCVGLTDPLAGGTKQGERTAECRRGLLCQDEEGREEDE